MTTHCVEVQISCELLREWLHLPKGVEVTRVSDAPMVNEKSFIVRIEHPLLPAWTEGPPPRWEGVFTEHDDGTVTAEWRPE